MLPTAVPGKKECNGNQRENDGRDPKALGAGLQSAGVFGSLELQALKKARVYQQTAQCKESAHETDNHQNMGNDLPAIDQVIAGQRIRCTHGGGNRFRQSLQELTEDHIILMSLVQGNEDASGTVFPRAIKLVGNDLLRSEYAAEERIGIHFIECAESGQKAFVVRGGYLDEIEIILSGGIVEANIRHDHAHRAH